MLMVLLGGARSGKSSLAIEAAGGLGVPVVFVATAEVLDDEFAERVGRHRAERPGDWLTIEEPIDLAGVFAGLSPDSAVVCDCLTLWVHNLIESGIEGPEIVERANQLAALAKRRIGATFVVSNEVGSGIVPADARSRHYRDLLGTVNAIFARHADEAFLVVAGQLLRLHSPAPMFDSIGSTDS